MHKVILIGGPFDTACLELEEIDHRISFQTIPYVLSDTLSDYLIYIHYPDRHRWTQIAIITRIVERHFEVNTRLTNQFISLN